MSPIEITLDSATRGIKALVAEFGQDFVYTPRNTDRGDRCVYVHEGKPDCIIGRFLASVGVPIERLMDADPGMGIPVRTLLDDLESEGVISTQGNLHFFLGRVQAKQDRGLSWGEALKGALNDM